MLFLLLVAWISLGITTGKRSHEWDQLTLLLDQRPFIYITGLHIKVADDTFSAKDIRSHVTEEHPQVSTWGQVHSPMNQRWNDIERRKKDGSKKHQHQRVRDPPFDRATDSTARMSLRSSQGSSNNDPPTTSIKTRRKTSLAQDLWPHLTGLMRAFLLWLKMSWNLFKIFLFLFEFMSWMWQSRALLIDLNECTQVDKITS